MPLGWNISLSMLKNGETLLINIFTANQALRMQKDGKFINSIKTGHLEAAVFCAALRCLKCKKNINKKKEKQMLC